MFTPEEKTLIEQSVILPYSLHYLDKESKDILNKTGFAIDKIMLPGIKDEAQKALFRIKNELRKRRIKVQSAKGWYKAERDGYAIENTMHPEAVKEKAVQVLIDMMKLEG